MRILTWFCSVNIHSWWSVGSLAIVSRSWKLKTIFVVLWDDFPGVLLWSGCRVFPVWLWTSCWSAVSQTFVSLVFIFCPSPQKRLLQKTQTAKFYIWKVLHLSLNVTFDVYFSSFRVFISLSFDRKGRFPPAGGSKTNTCSSYFLYFLVLLQKNLQLQKKYV